MKTWMFPVVMCVALASACVAPESDSPADAGAAARGVGEQSDDSAGAAGADAQAHDGSAAMGGAGVDGAGVEGPADAPTKTGGVPVEGASGSGLVDDQDASVSERCGTPVFVVLSDARAFRLDAATVDVELTGRLFASTPGDFGFRVANDAGVDITGRSWPEVESIEHHGDGTFTMRAKAASCADYTDAARISVQLYDVEREWHSNTLTLDVEAPDVRSAGASCEALGTACETGAWCNHARVCEAL